MYVQLNCAIIDADPTNLQELTAFLGQFGVNVVAAAATPDGLPSLLGKQDAPQLVIVNLDPAAHETLKRIENMPRQYPAVSFFVMSQTMDATLLMEAMHLGMKEFIPLPIPEAKFAAAIERVAAVHGMGKRARVLSFVPTIGGCGSTTVACNIAACLARTGGKTVLVDLDLMRGGVANYFDIRPRYTIADVMESTATVDRQLLDNALTVHAGSGLSILARPEMPEDTQRVNQPGLHRLLGLLSRMFDYVVIDSMMSIAPLYHTVLQASDVNSVVMQLNVPSCKNAERFVGALRRMGCESSKIKLLANRYVKKGWDIEPDEVERALGLSLAWMVPNDFKNAIAAINFGEPVVLRSPKSEMSTSLIGLAELLGGRAEAVTAKAA
jgi:pilus assembly protein CpaE